MAEYTATALQNVDVGNSVVFTATPIHGKSCVIHREGSGIFILRGIGSTCRARFRITFNGNITGETAQTEVALAIALEGEAIPSTRMVSTPATADVLGNVSASTFVDVPSGVGFSVSIRNVGETALDVADANLIIERVA